MITIPQRHRWTDRQTDGRTTCHDNTALRVASRGKNKARQPKRWIDDIKDDLSNVNVKIQEVMNCLLKTDYDILIINHWMTEEKEED